MHKSGNCYYSLAWWAGLICSSPLAVATPPGSGPAILDQVKVVGSSETAEGLPGSAHYVSEEMIRSQSYDDVNRVLRRVPGVYLREEDGFGLFPNISLRGVDTTRSAKVTLMEDSVLAAPAPYAAPAAYYSPTAGRMSGLEVLKGTSQIKYGPHTTGGVINYLSTPIPSRQRIYLKALYGEQNEVRLHAFGGDTLDTPVGRVGYLVEGYFRRSDGFKTIDLTPDFRDGDDTGFHNTEPMLKLSWEPLTSMYQRLEFKYGFTDRDADETYLGLSDGDFRADPFRRYAASRFDNIETEQHRTYLRYFLAPTDNLDLITTAYYNTFSRAWYKLNDLRNVPGIGNMSLSAALAGAGAGAGLACLKGEAACDLRVRNNNRDYYAQGLEQVGNVRFATGALTHEVNAGIRYHEDREERFQNDDMFNQAANGTVTDFTPGAPGSQANRVDEVKALAVFVQDQIRLGRWEWVPGVRFENLDFERRDRTSGITTKGDSLGVWGGGLGVVYDASPTWKLFGGVHRGFSPPSVGGRLNGLREETSLGFELGARYRAPGGTLAAELVGFHTDFDDLIVVSNIGGTGTGTDENFGEVRSYGAEFSLNYDAGIANGWAMRNPYFLTLTYTNAEQRSDARSTDAESIFSFGEKGNKVPYIPEWQLSAGVGIESTNWGLDALLSYVDATFTSASNTRDQVNGNGNPDARFGTTDDYWVVDFSGYYRLTKKAKMLAGVHNLFDEQYLVSRQPHGPRPGQARFAYLAVEFDF
ncbi:MAG: TonB-dependent receptor family protein [Gammaproteobacteria bacterium]